MTTNLIDYTDNRTYACTRCPWRGKFHEAAHSRLHGTTCPACRAELAPVTGDANTAPPDALDALFQLVAAVGVGHIRWPAGSRGEREAKQAVKRAREVLLRSRYRVQARDLGGPLPAESEPAP